MDNFIIQVNKDFEQRWEKYRRELQDHYNKKNKYKFLDWLTKPNCLDINTAEYRIQKSIAELYFKLGIDFYQKFLLKKYDRQKI